MHGIKENICLQTLDLSWNGTERAHAKDLALALMANSTLREINLNNNRLCGECAAHLANALSSNESLSSLKINGNHINEESFIAILKGSWLYNYSQP